MVKIDLARFTASTYGMLAKRIGDKNLERYIEGEYILQWKDGSVCRERL